MRDNLFIIKYCHDSDESRRFVLVSTEKYSIQVLKRILYFWTVVDIKEEVWLEEGKDYFSLKGLGVGVD